MVQETIKLFDDINSLAYEGTSQRQTKLIDLLIDCDFAELVQKMWRRYLRPQLLDETQCLPQHIHASLDVGDALVFLFTRATLC